MPAREVILTDPYIYADEGEGGATGGYGSLVQYLKALNLTQDSEFILRLNPAPKRATTAAKTLLARTVKTAFPRVRLDTFSTGSRFHDRFYLVRDRDGSIAGLFGPSLNGLGTDSVVLMGALEHKRTLERLERLFR